MRASEQEREDIKQKRIEWKNIQPKLSEFRLLFLDETGAKTNMTRRYGRSYRGLRCYDSAPDGRWERTSILSTLRDDGQTFSMIFEGALDRQLYDIYIEKVIAPELEPGDVVIMDNLNVHKSDKAIKLIEKRGAKCLFIPAYSPDLNPIEKMWSKIKQILRGIKARSKKELETAISQALGAVTKADAEGWLTSCGYKKSI